MAKAKRGPKAPSSAAFPRPTADDPCPCGWGRAYGECCGPIHEGRAAAPTAEALMRSRYSAFAVGDEPYLLRSWHPSTRPALLELDPDQRWLRLEILATEGGSAFHSEGSVEFRRTTTSRARRTSCTSTAASSATAAPGSTSTAMRNPPPCSRAPGAGTS